MGRKKLNLLNLSLDELCDQRSIPEPNTGCYLWLGPINRNGYGRVSDGASSWIAHRHVWELANGQKIPPGMLVRHKCDNPPCVNPQHLEIGTPADNMADKVRRGRAHWQPTSAAAREILKLWRTGRYSVVALADMYPRFGMIRILGLVRPNAPRWDNSREAYARRWKHT